MDRICRKIAEGILNGTLADKDAIQAEKIRLCGEIRAERMPSNSEILALIPEDRRDQAVRLLIKKPMRTASGVAVVAVMTSPHPCPHGKCVYCPGGVENDSPQSYTGKEPAARRAARNDFDPYRQVSDRIQQLEAIGHKTDKIDLIIMGGTFTSRDAEYQEWFVRRCLDAMNGVDSETLEEAQSRNRDAEHRCVGLTVETRPDVFDDVQIERAMLLGATRVELGVQILDDEILASVNRGHGVREIRECTARCRERGLKVCYHVMPGLPGSSPEKDRESFRVMFSDPDFRPDMLKIYTTLVIPGTGLHDMWAEGAYLPYDTETAVALIAGMKAEVPEYVRIQRIQRDIPAPEIAAGIRDSNIRQLVQREMAATGRKCRCIRCREVGLEQWDGEPSLNRISYEASGRTEDFISLESGDRLVGYVRLRNDGNGIATVRELKVFGRMAELGHTGEWQHRGFGRELMAEAERIAAENGARSMRVTSGVGVRGYYESLGYTLDRPYMVKPLRG